MKKLGIFLLFLISAALCFRQIGEPDVWWQVRTGQYILEHSEVPQTDVFSYTYFGEPWTNVKWLTEVVMAVSVDLLGFEFLMVVQLLVILGILFFSFKSSEIFLKTHGQNFGNPWPIYLGLGIFLLLGSFRMNGRPEMVSHLFTSIYLFIFLAGKEKKVLLWILIPLQALWANMHEAYGVGLVMTGVYFSTPIIIGSLKKKGISFSAFEGSYLSLSVFPLSWMATGVHPSGTRMWWYFIDIFFQLRDNQFTNEIFGFTENSYWQLPAFLLLGITLLILRTLLKGGNWKVLPPFYLILLASFLYLALGSYRNIPFFGIVAIPALSFTFSSLKLDRGRKPIIILSGFALFYFYVGSGNYYSQFLEREKYGLRVNPERTAIGSSEFLKANTISGKGYVDYLISSYYLYDLQPGFKSYIDLRDLDVFEAQFMQNVILSYAMPAAPVKGGKTLFQFIEEADTFSYVVVGNKEQFQPILSYLYQKDSTYHLVYADPLASIFLKENHQNRSLINNYLDKKPEDLFYGYRELETPGWAILLSKMVWPFYSEKSYSKYSVNRERNFYLRMLRYSTNNSYQ